MARAATSEAPDHAGHPGIAGQVVRSRCRQPGQERRSLRDLRVRKTADRSRNQTAISYAAALNILTRIRRLPVRNTASIRNLRRQISNELSDCTWAEVLALASDLVESGDS